MTGLEVLFLPAVAPKGLGSVRESLLPGNLKLRSLLVLLPETECAAVLALSTRPADIVALVDMCKVAQASSGVIVEILTLACVLYIKFDV